MKEKFYHRVAARPSARPPVRPSSSFTDKKKKGMERNTEQQHQRSVRKREDSSSAAVTRLSTSVNYYLLYYMKRRRIEKKLRQANERTRTVQRQPLLIGEVSRKKEFSHKKRSFSSIRETFSLLSIYVVHRTE